MNGQRIFKLGKFLSVILAAAFLFLSSGESEAYTHHEVSCADHHKASSAGGMHGSDCKNLPDGHSHSSNLCPDACNLGHCHGTYSGLPLQQKRAFHSHSSLDLGLLSRGEWVYRNPYLGKPLQPPRAK